MCLLTIYHQTWGDLPSHIWDAYQKRMVTHAALAIDELPLVYQFNKAWIHPSILLIGPGKPSREKLDGLGHSCLRLDIVNPYVFLIAKIRIVKHLGRDVFSMGIPKVPLWRKFCHFSDTESGAFWVMYT